VVVVSDHGYACARKPNSSDHAPNHHIHISIKEEEGGSGSESEEEEDDGSGIESESEEEEVRSSIGPPGVLVVIIDGHPLCLPLFVCMLQGLTKNPLETRHLPDRWLFVGCGVRGGLMLNNVVHPAVRGSAGVFTLRSHCLCCLPDPV